MNYLLAEWINLVLRWIHIFAAILWVGQTFLFSWLDKRLTEAAGPGGNGKVWMVHSGGFYVVERRTDLLQRQIHWFKWEAAITWISGFLLLSVVYHAGGLMVDALSGMSAGRAIGLGIVAMILGWAIYDGIWQSPLGRNEPASVVICFVLLVALTYALTLVMSGRAVYIHVGATLGTIMTANVWMRILPTQRRMIAALQQGQAPDAAPIAKAKQRTKHNTYMVFPVVAIMISNHFPVATYGGTYNWIVLAVLVLVGWAAAHIIRRTI